jgi:hypothetical protein
MKIGCFPHTIFRASQPDSLHLILGEPLRRAVVKLRCAGAFVRRHLLRVFECAAIGKIRRNTGRPKAMVANRRHDAGRRGAPADHPPGVGLGHRLLGQPRPIVARAGTKQPALAVFGDAGSGNIGVQFLGERVMARHDVMLATFLMQPQPPAGALRRRSSTFIFNAAVIRANE